MIDVLISVIIPIYNVESYLKECVDSILKQSYRNLEIILIDDGSTDGCPEICDGYAIRDSRVIVIHKKNGGLADARNRGLEAATGEYIAFVDSDDAVSLRYLEYLYRLQQEIGEGISICGMQKITENGQKYKKKFLKIKKTIGSKQAIENILYGREEYDVSAWGKLFPKALFKDIRFPSGKLYEDFAVMFELFWKARRVIYGSEVHYYYRVRRKSIMNSCFSEEKLILLDFSRNMVRFVTNCCPDLRSAAVRKDVQSDFFILRQMLLGNSRNRKKEEEIVRSIKDKTGTVLKDPKVSFKDKLNLIFLWAGLPFYRFFWWVYSHWMMGGKVSF